MSATTTNPMILSGDSLFEYTDFLNQPTSSAISLESEIVPMKNHNVEELSSNLPVLDHDIHTSTKSPFTIHSSVLDSVFSTNLDENDQFQDQTPMFDELDFIVDGAKVNLKEDWVSLFGAESEAGTPAPEFNTVVKDLDLMKDILPEVPPSNKRLLSEVEESFEFAPAKKQRKTTDVEQSQLFTPNPSSTLPTPLLDSAKPRKSSSVSQSSKKVDHLGCVTYSKKQRNQPLPPIEAATNDPVLLKRARNTEAARRSRARKMERMSQLEGKLEEIMGENAQLVSEVSRLKELLTDNGIEF